MKETLSHTSNSTINNQFDSIAMIVMVDDINDYIGEDDEKKKLLSAIKMHQNH